MKKIYKYPIEKQNHFDLQLPENAQILTVDAQKDVPCIWVLVDPTRPPQTRHFKLAGTGHPFDEENFNHIGTFQMYYGDLIFHLFEIFK